MHNYAEQQSPCWECPERHPLCHAECEKYQAYAAERARVNHQKALKYKINGYQQDVKERKRRLLRQHKPQHIRRK